MENANKISQYFLLHLNCGKVGIINLLKNSFEIIQHEVSYCITATNFLVIGYLIKCALHLKCISRNLFSKKNIHLKNYIPRHQDLLSHHNSVIDFCKPHKRSTSYDTSLSWCSSFRLQKPETNDPLFSKNCKEEFRCNGSVFWKKCFCLKKWVNSFIYFSTTSGTIVRLSIISRNDGAIGGSCVLTRPRDFVTANITVDIIIGADSNQ